MFYQTSALIIVIAITSWHGVSASLCMQKERLKLNLVAEARVFLNELINGSSGCAAGERQALDELNLILTSRQVDVCSMELVEKFERFHMKYVDSKSSIRAHLADFMRNFFVRLAMKLSYHCKRKLVGKFATDRHLLDGDDVERLEYFSRKDGLLSFVMKEPKSFAGLVLVTDIISQDSSILKERQAIRAPSGSPLSKLYLSCKHSFRPIYERRVLPILRLAYLGYDYQPKRNDIGSIEDRNDIKQLYRLTFLCSALLILDLVPYRPVGFNLAWGNHNAYQVIPSSSWEVAHRFTGKEAGKRTIIMPDEGEDFIDDRLFEDDGPDLDREVKKFRANKNYQKLARKKFINQISGRAARVLMKRVKIKDLVKSNRERSVPINISLLMKELEREQNKRAKKITLSLDRGVVLLFCFLINPFGWVLLLISYLRHIDEWKNCAQAKEKSGLIINV